MTITKTSETSVYKHSYTQRPGIGAYLAGGHIGTSTVTSTITKMTFATETGHTSPSSLQSVRTAAAAGESSYAGLVVGGSTSISSTNAANAAEYIPFSTESRVNLPAPNAYGMGMGSLTVGEDVYAGGGVIGSTYYSNIYKFSSTTTFTSAVYSGATSVAVGYPITWSSSYAGYIAGGFLSGGGSTLSVTKFTPTATSTLGTGLSSYMSYGFGVSSPTHGYAAGYNKFDLFTDTRSTVSITFQTQSYIGSPSHTRIHGYYTGGYTTNVLSNTDKLTFSTDTASVVTPYTSRWLGAAFQG